MKAISLFAGCGGSSLGYHQAGCEVVAAVEWEAPAAEAYRLNHPDTPVLQEDIANVTGAQLMELTGLQVGELDILDGSPPCQGFSSSNTATRTLDNPKNILVKQQLRLVQELQPKCVLIENVAGMLRGVMQQVAREVVFELRDLGYQVCVVRMEAQYFGVAQTRPRAFFMASRLGMPQPPRPTTQPVPCKVALDGIEPRGPSPPEAKAKSVIRLIQQNLQPGERAADMLARLVTEGVTNEQLRLRAEAGHWFNWRMIHPDYPAKTLCRLPCYFHWDRRRLSISEGLVLTGFPEDYMLTGNYGTQWGRIGNAVVPAMTREITKQTFEPILSAD